jgi:glycosyltransferase involved in cell wall biosynthesis
MSDATRSLWSVIEARDAGILRLREIEGQQHANLVEKERVIQVLTEDLSSKQEALEELTADLTDKEAALKKLTADLTHKEAAIQKRGAVIREQRRALAAYRHTFFIFGALIVLLNHLVLGVRSVYRRTIRGIAPRLGVLHQHAPMEMRIPKDRSRPAPPSDVPRISIVTPSFRQAPFIERTIRSVIEQSYPNLEYYVQDGGSQDGTAEVLARYQDRLAGWQSTPDNGQAEAINRAFAKTSGDIMAYLNSDDILLPGALARVADYFVRHPEVDVVYGHRVVIDEDDRQIGRWIMPAHDDKVLSWADFVPQETLFWRRSIWEKSGGRMDESFQFALDWDLLVRFREAGARFARLPRFLGGFRVHAQQKTTTSIADTGIQEMNRIRKRVLGTVPTNMEVRKAVFPYMVRHMFADLRWKIEDKLGIHS